MNTVTIITINFNNAAGLRGTIESVLEQKEALQETGAQIEYLIVDGGSTDGSLDIIREYESDLTSWVSEPDRGIYDAMNKGTALARGQWVNFMNSGDGFTNPQSLARVFETDVSDVDVIYGDYILSYPGTGDMPRRGASPDEFWKGLNICHQTFFVRREFLTTRPFDVNLRIAADFQFANRCVAAGARFLHKDFPISTVTAGGLSDVDRVRSLRECLQVLENIDRENGGTLSPNKRGYYRRRIIREQLRRLMPDKLIQWVLRFKSS